MKAMILAAGLGTRLKPWTDTHPKALAEVNGKSLLQLNVTYLQSFGIYDTVVNVHHFAEQIISAIDNNNGWGSNITISNEVNEVLETGGGILNAAPSLSGGEPFVVMNVDVLTDLDLSEMMDYHQEYMPLATLATTQRQTSRYLLFNRNDDLVGWQNTSTGELKGLAALTGNEQARAFSGIHILDPAIFNNIKFTGKFSMIDVYLNLMKEHSIRSFDHSGTKFIDVGKPESIRQAAELFSF